MLGFERMGRAVRGRDPVKTPGLGGTQPDQRLQIYMGTLRPMTGPYSSPTPQSEADGRDKQESKSDLLDCMPAWLRKDDFVQRNFTKLALLACASEDRHPNTRKPHLKVRCQVACAVMGGCTGLAWQGPGYQEKPGGGVDVRMLSEPILIRPNQGWSQHTDIDTARVQNAPPS